MGGWSGKGGKRPVPKETPIMYTTKVITAEPAKAGACSWGHNGKEYISPLTDVLIDPNQDELVAYLLSGLCKAQITPAHIAEVRDQVHWVYRENQ